MDAGEAPDAAAKAAVVAAAPAVDAAEMITCIVCLHLFCMNDFPSKKSTRYAGHCPKCSLQLRGILNASKGSLPTTSAADEAAGCSEMSGAGDDTSKYLQNLAKEDPEKYRQIFKEYGESGSAAGKRGRGNQRQPFNPRTVPLSLMSCYETHFSSMFFCCTSPIMFPWLLGQIRTDRGRRPSLFS